MSSSYRTPAVAVVFAAIVLLMSAGSAAARPIGAETLSPSAVAAALPGCTIIGTAASEVIAGTRGDDVICALGGNDRVNGRGGDDTLFGSVGNDRLNGGRGNDRLFGWNGVDRLRGGRGNDWIQGSRGPDLVSGGPGTDMADYRLRTRDLRISLDGRANDGWADEGDNVRVENVRTGSGDDVVIGSRGANRLYGGRGNDRLRGRRGDDRLWGNRGDDRLMGRDSNGFVDWLRCGGGDDVAMGDAPDHVVGCERANLPEPSEPSEPPAPVNHAPSGISLSSSAVAENRPAGTVVGTLTAADRDRGQDHTFALVAGGPDNGSFRIDGSTLRTAAVFNYEAKRSYSIRVRARDDGDPAKSVTRSLTVSVTNANEAPTGIGLAPRSVAENQPKGTAVGTLTATDPDPGDSATFALVPGAGSTDNGSFRIDGSTLRTDEIFDHEIKDTYSIRVRATDSGTPAGQIVRTFTITVTDVNEAPFGLDLQPRSVAENEPVGTTVGSLSVSDEDVGDSSTFTLVAGAGSGDNGSFQIVGSTLRTAAVLDFETKSSYSVRVRATDHGTPARSTEQQFTITVTDTTEPPKAFDDSATVAEDAAATAIDVLANDTDPENDPRTIASASDPAHGTVVLTGGSAGAHTALTYEPDPDYCNDPPGTAPDTFTYTLTGGSTATGSTATVSVTVTCVQDLPTAVNDTATVPEDSVAATPIDVLANDTDPDDGDTITIVSATDPLHGTMVLTGGLPGAHTGLTYQPDPGYCNDPPGIAPDTFTYMINGGSTATVSVTVTCDDDAPTAVNDTATVAEDSGAGAIDVLANDTDPDGGPKAIASASDPANGTVVLTGGPPATGLTYSPDANYCGPDTFTYTLNGGSSATVSVTVTCVDDLPTAVADSATVVEDSGAGAIDVLANDTDIDGGPKVIASASDPAKGTVVLTGGSPGAHTGLTYQPDPDYCNDPPGTAPDTFTYTLDGGSTATVSVTVTCVEDLPTAVNDSATVPEDAGPTPLAVLVNDTDPDGGPMTIASATDPANGTVALTGGLPGAHTGLTYQPDPSYCNDPPGTTLDTFTYTLNGGSTATVSVTVTCNDDPPTAVNDTATVAEDSGASAIDVLANDTDSDGGPKAIASASGAAHGTVVLTGGSPGAHTGLTYSPDANYCGPDTFTYTLNGGSTATVSVTVTCVDDPPTAVNDTATVAEDSGASAVDVLANDTDPDGGSKTIASASDPANGTVVLTGGPPATGLTYSPDANYCGPDTFTYTLTGGSMATVSVTVTCAPDDPVVDASAGSTSYTENAAATVIDAAVTVTDPDAGTTITGATVKIAGGGAEDVLGLGGVHPGITALFSGDTLTLSGLASPAAYQSALRDVTYLNTSENPSTAPRTVTFTVTDDTARSGSDTKGITVTAVDDPPTAVNDSATVLEDAAATAVTVLINDTDVDGGPMSIASVTQPANGTVVITGGGTGLTYQPNPNYCNDPPGTTPSTFTYTLNGGSSATVSMTVTCVNDVPDATNDSFTGASGAIGNTSLVVDDPSDGPPALSTPKKGITGDILSNDTDVDGPGPLAVVAETKATADGGSVTIQADGDFIFTPKAETSCTDHSDSFTYTLSDQNATGPGPTPGTDTGTVTIDIAGCVWYVRNNAAAGGDGVSTNPFDTLAEAEAKSNANDTVFVFDGNNTSAGYDEANGYTMNAGERLIGEHEGLVVDPDQGGPLAAQTLFAANPGARPTITANGADVIDLDDGNEIRGVEIDPRGTGGGIAGTTGDTGGGTLDDVTINDVVTAGTQPGLELNGTTGVFNITNLSVTNNATGVLLNNAGTVDFGTTTINTTGAKGLDATGTNMNTSTFDAITVTGSTTGGVKMLNTTGTTVFGDGTGTDLALATSAGTAPAFDLNNAGTITVGASGTDNVSATGGPAIDVTGTTGAQLAFDDVDSTNSAGAAGDGINLAGLGTGAGAGTFSAATGDITGAAVVAFDLDGGSGDVTYPGAIGDGSGQTAEITNRSGGTVTLSGNINDTNDAGGGISLSGNTGGTTTFSGTTKKLDTGSAAALNASFPDSSTASLTLSGGALDIDTTSGSGLVASGVGGTPDGTITVTGTGNTIDTTTGTALNVANTTIANTGLTFRSIAANGAANGIVLNNTGSTGSLTVTGSGSSAQGGDNSGGTIQSTSGHGISLTNTTSPSFRNVRLLNTGNSGINGTQVTGFSFTDGTITGAGDASDENSITFDDSLTATPNLTGAVTITNNVISQTEAEGVDIENWGGTITDANISGNALSDTGDVATPGSAVTLIDSGTATSAANITKATVANNAITDFRAGVGVQVRAGNPTAGGPTGSAGTAGNATNIINVIGNSMNGGNAGIGNQPDRFFTGGVSGNGGQGNFNVSNNGTAVNRIRNIDCIAIEMQMDGPVTMTSTVQNNFINANSAVGCAGIAVGTDDPSDLGAGTHTTTISGNNVMGTDGPGIFPIVRDSGSTMTAKVLNNTVAAPIATNAARAGIRVDSGSAQGDTTMCLEISGNTTAGSTNSGTATTSPGINLRKQGTDPNINTFGIEGMAATASPGVENYVNGLNTSTSGTFGTGGTALLSAQSGFTNCNAP